MLHHLGASYLVEAPVPTIEENGSDSFRMPFLMAPRRPGLPAKSAPLLGPGPQARGTLATFLPWKVARPQAEYPLKQNRGFAAAAASFFLSDQKETKESPGVGVFRKDLRLTPWSFRNPTHRTPVFTGEPEGYSGTRSRRGSLLNGVWTLSLPLCSVNETGASTR